MAVLKAIELPDILIADAEVLLHLARADALPLLHQVGGMVILADMLAFEITRDLTTPGAVQVCDWIAAGQATESNAPVTVEGTDTGHLFAIARQTDPEIRARETGERAIIDWLAEKVQGINGADRATMVIYQNGRLPRIVANQGNGTDVELMTTRAFLQLAAKKDCEAAATDN